ncbi:hypothetical protein [Halovivax limisalsi]|uniref:hypothetical protein n=1 Tax=Halovivax limisalsi TaxID=1453760 RepID=UPI001FFCCFA1|nr:hypothetical protein [Halovivax limisalsi]
MAYMTDSSRVEWHRDADTSLAIRLPWALGVGSLLAAISLVVFGRVFGLATQIGGQKAVIGLLFVVGGAVLAGAFVRTRRASAGSDGGPSVQFHRGVDAAVGAVAMGAVIFGLDTYVEGSVGELLAAATIPIGLGLLVLAIFLRSTGIYDREAEVIYLYDPEEAIDLDDLESVSARHLGASAYTRLRYRTPDGEYVPGPRRLILPSAVARELEATLAG